MCLIVGLFFDRQFEDSFIVFKNVQLRLTVRRMRVCRYVIHISQLINLLSSFVSWCLGFRIGPRTIILEAIIVAWCQYGWVGQCCWWNVTPQLLCMPQRSRASIPSTCNPVSRKMISDSVGLCDTQLCFLRIQLTVKQCSTSEDTQDTLRLIPSLQGLQQSLSLGMNPIYNAELCCPHDSIVGIRLRDEGKLSIVLVVSHTLESILWLISDHRMSGRPNRVKYKYLKTICG